MEKITNMEEMEKLYIDGRISKTTLWRGKKRGWIKVDYHKPHHPEHQDTTVSWNDILDNYDNIRNIVANEIRLKGIGFDMLDDITNDCLIYLYERQQSKYVLKVAKSFARNKTKLIRNRDFTEKRYEDKMITNEEKMRFR